MVMDFDQTATMHDQRNQYFRSGIDSMDQGEVLNERNMGGYQHGLDGKASPLYPIQALETNSLLQRRKRSAEMKNANGWEFMAKQSRKSDGK